MGLTLPYTRSLGWMLAALTIALPYPNRVAIAFPQISSVLASNVQIPAARRAYLIHLARKFTVRIETPDNQGSGVIVKNQAGTYAVITNEHVILDHDQITIQTHDGRTYAATRQSPQELQSLDLQLLTFKSPRNWYPVAMLKPGLASAKGSPVIAAGFPHELNGETFQATDGKISYITPKGLNGGYRIGYSNNVPKGMSGGPVINQTGQVIAINGLHSEPLWGNPYVWDDGTRPSDKLVSILSKLSWAIPTETVIQSLSSSFHL